MLPAPRRARPHAPVLRAAASGVALVLAALAAGSTGSGPVDLGRVEQVADVGAPPAPTGVVVTPGDGRLTVRWNPSSGAASYRILINGSSVGTTTNNPVTLTGAANGQPYTVTVTAIGPRNLLGQMPESDPSAPVTAAANDGVPPAAPTGATATPGDRSATLRWTAPADSDVVGYQVLDASDTLVATTTAPTTTVTVSGLANGTASTFRIRATDQSRNTGATVSVTVVPADAQSPGSPTGVTAVAGDRRAVFSWTAPADSDLRRYEVRTADGTVLATAPAGTTTVTITGLVNGAPLSARVFAVDTSANSSAGSTAVTVTPRDAVPPAPPTAVTATPGDRSAVVRWTTPADTDLARYEVRSTAGVLLGTAGAGATGLTLTGLSNGTAVSFVVRAVDTSDNTSPDSTVVVVTPRDAVAPGAPTAVRASPGDQRVVLTWTAPRDSDVVRYSVRTGTAGGPEVASATGTSAVLTGLVNGTPGTWVVVAIDSSGNASAASGAVTATPRDSAAPSAPTALTATGGDGRASLSWTPGPDADLARYEVLDESGAVVATAGGGASGAAVTGLANGTSRTFRVVAVDTSGNRSPATAGVAVTPRDTTAPGAPTAVTATPGDGAALVRWTAPADTDLARFEVRTAAGALLATTGPGASSVTVTGLTNGTALTLVVRAVDTSANASPDSTPVAVTPRDAVAPGAPTALTAAPGDGRVVLAWTAPADPDVARYSVRTPDGTEVASTTTATSVVLTGLVNGTPVTWVVVAVDTSGNPSAAGGPVTATPRDTTAPAAPTAVAATPGSGSATLSWTPGPDTDVVRFEVVDESGAVVATAPGSATGAVVTGLVDGTPRTFAVVAVDAGGNRSPLSASVGVTPAAPSTSAPTGVRLTPGDGRVGVTWTAVAGATSYVVTRDPGGVGAAATTTTGTGLLLTGLVNGREVVVTVTAVVGADRSDPSAEVRATPAAVVTTASVGSGSSALAGSRDGRFAVVGTAASLEASDTNRASELYLLDAVTGTRTRIAPLPAGWSSSGTDAANSGAVALSEDGRYAVLVTTARRAPGDTNSLADVYRVELATGTWQLVSVPGTGSGAGRTSATAAGTLLQAGSSVYSTGPSVVTSADGRYVGFYSERPDLVTGDTNAVADVFRKDMTTGAVLRVSSTATGAGTGRTATGPALAMTPDGRFVVFTAQPSSGGLAAFRKDTATGELVLASSAVVGATTTELAVDRDAHDVSVSDDGRYVGFSSAHRAASSTPAVRGGSPLAFRKDLTTGAVVALGSGQTGVWEHGVQLDPTGAFGFYMTASGQDPADTDGHTDWYRTEAATGARVLVTTRADGSPSPRVMTGSVDPSEYGTLRALSSTSVLLATKQSLVSGDVNALTDVYAKDLTGGGASAAVAG